MERLPWTAVRFMSTRLRDFQAGTLKGFCIDRLKNPAGPDPYTAHDFEDLRATGANVVRVPIILNKQADGAAYAWPEADVAYAERVLAHGARLGLRVIITVHPLPGGQVSEWWGSASLQQSLASTWGQLARRLEFCPALQGYDLINEPTGATYDADRKTYWTAISQNLCNAIRAEDRRTPILWEPCWWGLPGSFWQSTPPVADGLVASFHWYDPHSITHQGLPGYPAGQPYPTDKADKGLGYERMGEARKFCARYGLPMFVGEFSCVRWASGDSARQYISDALDLFDTERWGWTYHVWRGYDGWDSEIPQGVAQDTGNPADRRADSSVLAVLTGSMG